MLDLVFLLTLNIQSNTYGIKPMVIPHMRSLGTAIRSAALFIHTISDKFPSSWDLKNTPIQYSNPGSQRDSGFPATQPRAPSQL